MSEKPLSINDLAEELQRASLFIEGTLTASPSFAGPHVKVDLFLKALRLAIDVCSALKEEPTDADLAETLAQSLTSAMTLARACKRVNSRWASFKDQIRPLQPAAQAIWEALTVD